MKGYNNSLIATGFIIAGVLSRTVFHAGPNIELVTVLSLMAGVYLKGRWAVIIPLFIMVFSDMIIGNTNIFLFTWSAYPLIALVGSRFLQNNKNRVLKSLAFAPVASIWFYLWTNFGVWLLDSWRMYERTASGLLECFIMGLPFLKINLFTNMVFVPLGIFVTEHLFLHAPSIRIITGRAIKLLYGYKDK